MYTCLVTALTSAYELQLSGFRYEYSFFSDDFSTIALSSHREIERDFIGDKQ